MSELENKIAKPILGPMILDGAERILSATDLAGIATFAFKTAVVADHMNSLRQSSFFSSIDTQKFAASLAIPSWVQMWLAEFRSAVSPSALMFTDYRKGRSRAVRGYEIYVVTYALGHLAFQVVSQRRTKVALGPAVRPFVTQHPKVEFFASEFWPLRGSSLTWPPPYFLDDEAIETFCYRWRNLS